MKVVWAGTSHENGRFNPSEHRSDLTELSTRFTQLRSLGHGYLEVHLTEDFPQLTLGFRDDLAVIQMFKTADAMALLQGDGTAADDALVEIPVMDEAVTFTGNFVRGLDDAWDRVTTFIRTGSPDRLGEWFEL
jgi:hypothetical protein